MRLALQLFSGEPAISGVDWNFSDIHTSSPPFSISLDAVTRGDLQIMLKKLVDEQGITCLFVTHDMDEAFVVARRVVVMRGGRAAATFEAEEFSGWERRERVRDHILTCLGRKQGA